MGYLKVTAEELNSVAAQLQASAAQIADENARALSLVNGLVGQGWEGAASGQFAALFQKWKTSADQMQETLHGISGVLSNAGALYAQTEQEIQRHMTQ